MYSYLKGEITEINASHITIEVYGVGYLVKVANPYSFILNESITLFIHQAVREDAIELYGFHNHNEKETFEKLISVKGLGPKGALAILASCTTSDIKEAVEASNAKFFMKFPGIGNKLSQQIILDLKGKIDFDSTDSIPSDERIEQISLALKSLGYNNTEIKNVIKKLKLEKDTTISDAIKIALKLLKM